MKHIIICYLLVALTGCGGIIKKGGMVEASNALDKGNFEEAIEYTEIVESFGDLSPEEKAKLHYLRALALEGLGMLQSQWITINTLWIGIAAAHTLRYRSEELMCFRATENIFANRGGDVFVTILL